MTDPAILAAVLAAQQMLNKAVNAGGDKSPTLDELFTRYWDVEGKYLTSAQRTWDAWKAIKDIPGEDGLTLKERKSSTITAEVVEEMREWIRKHHVTRFNRCPRPATINREIIVLRRVLNWGVDEHHLSYMPLRVKLEDEHNVQKTRIGNEEDFQKLLAECDPYNRALCLLFFDCGLRRNEGLYLRRFQLQVEADGIATIVLHQDDTKTKEARTVALTKRTLEALEALPQRGSYFFARQDGKAPIDVRHLYRKFQEAVARSGLKAAPGETIKWHTLRHSFCYVRRTIDRMQPITVMAFTGHKTDSVFRRYGITDTHEIKSAVSYVEARLAAQSKAAAEAKQASASAFEETPRIASRKR